MIRIIFFNEINITVYLFINYEFKEEEEQEDEFKKKNNWKNITTKVQNWSGSNHGRQLRR